MRDREHSSLSGVSADQHQALVHTHESGGEGGILANAALPGLAIHEAAITGIHGAGSNYLALSDQEALVVSKVVWKAASSTAKSGNDLTVSEGWLDVDLLSRTSAKAKYAILLLRLDADVIGSGSSCLLAVRKNGDTPSQYPSARLDKAGATVGVSQRGVAVVGLDSAQIIEYFASVGTGWTLDFQIDVLGYIE